LAKDIITTGSDRLDRVLGGGIRVGMLTDVYGESGSGKSQFCFMLCANYKENKNSDQEKVVFIDTAGCFRPERIQEMSENLVGKESVLERILFVRALNIFDQINALKKIEEINTRLVIIDSGTALFSEELKGPFRHLTLMNYLHQLSIVAINFKRAVVFTNMVRSILPPTSLDKGSHGSSLANNSIGDSKPSLVKEFMESSVALYAHFRIRFEVCRLNNSLFRATLMRPYQQNNSVCFNITNSGIS
jgi:RecA/RadA recombinase